MRTRRRPLSGVIVAAVLLVVVPSSVDAAIPSGATIVSTPVTAPYPPGPAFPQAASVTGTADGSSVVHYAGGDGSTWTYAPGANAWTQQLPAVSPSPRQGAAAGAIGGVPGSERKTLLFGGFQEVGEVYFDETWSYDVDAGTWSKRCGPCVPGALTRSMVASNGEETLLFGGATLFGFYQSVWRWNDVAGDWVPIVPASPEGIPPGRGDGQFAFDGTNFVLYGGLDGSYRSMADTWVLVNEGGGAYRWDQVCDDCPPGPRSLAGFASIGGNGAPAGVLLAGGTDVDSHLPAYPVYSDTWFWDGTDQTWTQVLAGVEPTTTPEDPAVPYSPTLASFGLAGQPQRVVMTAFRFDVQGTESTESNVLAWQLPPPPTTTTTSTSTSTTSTSTTSTIAPRPLAAAPVVVTPRLSG